MTFVVDGTNGLTFNDATTQSSTATNASNISSGTLGKARLPTGSVLQVVTGTLSTQTSVASSTPTSTGLTASITPLSSSNKIYISVSSCGGQNTGGRSAFFYIYRGASSLMRLEANDTTNTLYYPICMTYLDSPATTSSTTYTVYFATDGVGTNYFANANTPSAITLMEIAA